MQGGVSLSAVGFDDISLSFGIGGRLYDRLCDGPSRFACLQEHGVASVRVVVLATFGKIQWVQVKMAASAAGYVADVSFNLSFFFFFFTGRYHP